MILEYLCVNGQVNGMLLDMNHHESHHRNIQHLHSMVPMDPSTCKSRIKPWFLGRMVIFYSGDPIPVFWALQLGIIGMESHALRPSSGEVFAGVFIGIFGDVVTARTEATFALAIQPTKRSSHLS